jgi:hypothetical protein
MGATKKPGFPDSEAFIANLRRNINAMDDEHDKAARA